MVVGGDYGALGIEVRYENVAEVGPDRVVNALATREFYGAPAVAVDFGTATTFDVVAADGAYVGGVIAPGVVVSAKNLIARAARLGAVDFTMPPRVVGRNTDEALRAGIILGAGRAAAGQVEATRAGRAYRGAPSPASRLRRSTESTAEKSSPRLGDLTTKASAEARPGSPS